MIKYIICLLVNAIGFYLGSQLLRGVKISSFSQSFILAFAVSILNLTIGLLANLLSLGLASWGIFSLILDAFLIKVADKFMDEVEVDSIWWAIALAIIVSIANFLLFNLIY